jgi:2-phosphosulfolactate phosphatase
VPTLNVHFLPRLVPEDQLAGSTVVVIDLLRASSTICQALASGATCVMPFLEIEETRRAAERFPRGQIVIGGERNGELINGFDLGNSPLEYVPAAVAGRRVLFTTTNGTRALHHARQADRTLVGAALNGQALVNAIADTPRVDILCAGTDGEITGEDIFAAGAILHALLKSKHSPGTEEENESRGFQLNQSAISAVEQWRDLLEAAERSGRTPSAQLAEQIRETPGGRNLLEIGHEADLTACAQLDLLDVVPELNRRTHEIRPA